MFRPKLALLCVFCCCLMTAGLLGAAEVALVTEKIGSVTASTDSDTWEVELAEILQDGVEIKVAADGSLVIIHLPTNQEYTFAPEATAKLATANVTGEKFTSTAVEMVSSKIALGPETENQTGAVNPERVAVPQARAKSETRAVQSSVVRPSQSSSEDSLINTQKTADKSSNSEIAGLTNDDDFAAQPAPAEQEQKKKESESSAANVSPSAPSSGAPSQSLSDESPSELLPEGGMSIVTSDVPANGFVLAMPCEVFARICSDEETFSAVGENLTGSRIAYWNEDWVEIEILCDEEFSGNLSLNGNVASMTLTAFAPIKASIVAAWKLEKNGHLYQAAAMWISLQKSGLTDKQVGSHLKRLKAAILKLN